MTAPKKPLAPGDRVAVYGWANGENHWNAGEHGVVTKLGTGAAIYVLLDEFKHEATASDSPDTWLVKVHPKQVRRLVRRERRRVWVCFDKDGPYAVNAEKLPGVFNQFEFVEARKAGGK